MDGQPIDLSFLCPTREDCKYHVVYVMRKDEHQGKLTKNKKKKNPLRGWWIGGSIDSFCSVGVSLFA